MFLFCILSFIALFVCLSLYIKYKRNQIKSQLEFSSTKGSKIVAFFHPFCNAAGGGERVLWAAIKSLHSKYPHHSYVIYSDNYNVSPEEILLKANRVFQIETNFPVKFVKLNCCFLLSPKMYPVLTILFQNFFSLFLGIEALFKYPPDILIDTMGASFIFPIFKLIGSCKICAYVHYPTISVDMLNAVADNVAAFNNRQFIARNATLTKLKLVYYNLFALLYKLTGKCADVILVNSSWTRNHITQIWNTDVSTVYPPCNTSNLRKLELTNRERNIIISMGQFRPEKNHQLQIDAHAQLLKLLKENGTKELPKLVVIGSCRDEEDKERIEQLKALCTKLHIEEYVQFKVNMPYLEMETLMGKANIAIHTMINEHFGISVVEFLAAGLLTVTHNSGGPKLDIIQENSTGFFATNSFEFANVLYKLLRLSENEANIIRKRARDSTERFSEETFEQSFRNKVEKLF